MYGNVNAYEMRMPTYYVDMTAEEMEYDGGLFGVALSLVGMAFSIASAATGDKTLGAISNTLTVVGAATSLGTGCLACKGLSIALGGLIKKGAPTTVKNDDALGYYLAGVGLDTGSAIVGVATRS